MELPIVATTHVPGREQVVRAWIQALEMVGGSTDGLVERTRYQRVFVPGGRGTAWHDVAFGFEAGMTGGEIEAELKGDALGLPRRVVVDGGGLEGLGYARRELQAGVLSQTRMDWEIRGNLQVLPARASYRDVAAFGREGLELMLDEPRLDMLLLRDGGGPVAYGAVMTVNTMGLIVDFHVKAGAGGTGVAETMLWYLLELCGRSQHKSVGVVIDDRHEVFEKAGFKWLGGVGVWDRVGDR